MTQESLNLLKDLELLCRAWRDLVREGHPGGWHDYAEGYVACYFAISSGHTAVRIGGFEISFHPSPNIDFAIQQWTALAATISKGREYLEAERAQREARSDADTAAAKEARKQALLKQLQELEAA